MIPRIIHYCWFGGKEKPSEIQMCINSWKNNFFDYEFLEWNETTFSIENSIPYVKEAYQEGKWAFVADYVRLYALRHYGGIYIDTDVQVFRPFDSLLNNEGFLSFESNDYVCTAVMGFKKGCWLVDEFLRKYESRHFILSNGLLDTATTNVVMITKILVDHGLILNGKQQTIEEVAIYPQTFFSDNSFMNIFKKYRRDSYAYHHCYASWYDNKNNNEFYRRIRHYCIGVLRNTIGTSKLYRIKRHLKK